mmetsp:Transcript_5296/g.4490  ORF Transcript_5296/g.4490 Transcript_5296/m.4490 type:complete len:146 (+) Transcript_5296:52-489(+)
MGNSACCTLPGNEPDEIPVDYSMKPVENVTPLRNQRPGYVYSPKKDKDFEVKRDYRHEPLGAGVIYVGEINTKDGVRDGKGKITFADGSTYEGFFKESRPNGKGRFTNADGDVYEGDWVEGKCHGHGNFYSASGGIYSGEWYDNC